MVKENCKKVSKRAGSILVGMLLLMGVLMGYGSWNASARAENSGGGGASESLLNEQDGSKIESIHIQWLTKDTTDDGDPNHLYLSTTSDAELQMQWQIDVSFSGQYDYQPGDIRITIPRQIWHPRNEQRTGENDPLLAEGYVGGMELSVPDASVTTTEFHYDIVGDHYVITNTKVVGATSKAMFQFTFNGIVPHQIVDRSESDSFYALVEVTTNQGNLIALKSDELQAQLDTQERINNAFKTGEFFQDIPDKLPRWMLDNLPEDDQNPDNYVYVRWYSYPYYTGNQNFTLAFSDQVGEAWEVKNDGTLEFVEHGIMLGCSDAIAWKGELHDVIDADGTVHPHALYTETIQENTYNLYGGTKYNNGRYIWTAYKKDAFKKNITYHFDNTCEWTLTEQDPAYPWGNDTATEVIDEKLVTTAKATAAVQTTIADWEYPPGRFMVFKYADTSLDHTHPTVISSQPENREHTKTATYEMALNQLREGKDVDMLYEVLSVGYGYIFTAGPLSGEISWVDIHGKEHTGFIGEGYDPNWDSGAWADDPAHYLNWYYTMDTADRWDYFAQVNAEAGDPQLTTASSDDYEFRELFIAEPELFNYGKLEEFDQEYVFSEASLCGFEPDDTLAKPPVSVYVEMDNSASFGIGTKAGHGDDNWLLLGTFDIPEGGLWLDFSEYADVTGGKPVTGYRTRVETNQAAIKLATYPIIRLKASERVRGIAETLFSASETPSTTFRNDDQMYVELYTHAEDAANTAPEQQGFLDPQVYYRQYVWQDNARSELTGAGYGVRPSKRGDFENDIINKRVLLHYDATVVEESNLTELENYERAVEQGAIDRETSGVWYDLLPEGVQPLLDTVKLRSDDTIVQKYTIDNYKDSGRVLLVVEAELTPKPHESFNGDRVADTLSLSFDAYYPWDQIDITGNHLVNYVAFESGNDKQLGTLLGRIGEPDAMKQLNNVYTPDNEPEAIVNAMTDLDPTTEENRFVYAKSDMNLVINRMAVSDYNKAVKSDLEGIWTQGLDNQVQVNVYEGQHYTYRLRVHSSQDTITKDMVLYDTIENYDLPHDGTVEHDTTKQKDYDKIAEHMTWYGTWQEKGKGQWRGTLTSVDVKEFLQMDVAPVLYYALEEDLQFGDTIGTTVDETIFFNKEGRYQLTDESTWKQVEAADIIDGIWTVPEGMNVSAIAIDARHCTDGSDFELQPDEAVAAYLHMVAPDDHEDSEHWGPAKSAYARKKGMETSDDVSAIDWEAAMNPQNNLHAFNNTRLICTQLSGEGDAASKTTMIRNDYTRVGIMPQVMKVTKEWEDQNNHDGIRPESIMVQLERKLMGERGEDAYQPVGEPFELNKENDWSKFIAQRDVVNEEGIRYLYRFVDTVDGYTSMSSCDNGDGTFTLVNRHKNEKISLSGEKHWVLPDGTELPSDAKKFLPEFIRVTLLQDGKEYETITVHPNAKGIWSYTFTNLDKYVDHGAEDFDPAGNLEHVYTIKEEPVEPFISGTGDVGSLPEHIKDDFQLNEDLFTDQVETIYNLYLPYGDLSVGKTVQQANDASSNTEFKYMLFLESADGEPVSESYRYAIVDAETGAVVDAAQNSMPVTGTIGHNSGFTLRGGQKLMVYNLPTGTKYTVFEEEQGAFTCTASSGTTGTIGCANVTEATFENTYNSETSVQFKVEKALKGTDLKRGRFRFTITDKTEGSDTYDKIIRSAVNDLGKTELDEHGTRISLGEVLFGSINYTQDDLGADGKATFVYEIAETKPTDAPDYFTYDEKKYTVTVNLTDRGDGTIDKEIVYPENLEKVSFTNTYHASGTTPVKTWKELKGRPMTEGEFEFALYRLEEDGTLTPVGEHAHSAEDGTIAFPELTFTEADHGKTYTYVVQEVVGDDPTVYYNQGFVGVRITVTDQGDGTLSFERENVEVDWEHELCPTCGGSGYDRPGQLNWVDVVDNSGEVTRDKIYTWTNPSGEPLCKLCHGSGLLMGDQACNRCHGTGIELGGNTWGPIHGSPSKFIFDEELGRWVAYGEWYYSENPSNPAQYRRNYQLTFYTDPHTCEACAGTGNVDKVPNTLVTKETDELPIVVNGLAPGNLKLEKVVDDARGNGELFTFHITLTGMDLSGVLSSSTATPAPTAYPNYIAPPVPDIKPEYYPVYEVQQPQETAAIPAAVATPVPPAPFPEIGGEPDAESTPYHVTEEELAKGEVYAIVDKTTGVMTIFRTHNLTDPDGNPVVFADGKNYVEYDNLIYEKGFEDNWYPYNQSYVKEIRMEDGFKPSYLGFGGYSNCVRMDLSKLDVSGLSSLGSAFAGCSSLKSVNLTGWDTSNVTTISNMFAGCGSLETLKLPKLDTSKVTSASGMFASSSVVNVDLSMLDFSGIVYADGMFYGCSSLKSTNLKGLDFSNVQSMNSMFSGCSSLERLDLSGLDTSKATDFSYIFGGCTSLTDLRLDGWDARKLTNLSNMFSGCTSLERLSMRNWNWENSSMGGIGSDNFNGCTKLNNIDVSGWNMTGKEYPVNYLSAISHCGGDSIILNASNWKVPDITDISGLFANSPLRAVDMSGWTDSAKLTAAYSTFYSCPNLEYVNLSGLDTSHVTGMASMFNGCSKLKTVDIKDLDVSSVTVLASMFENCSSLTHLNLADWNTANVTVTDSMFKGCTALTDLNLNNWKVGQLADRDNMFNGCTALKRLSMTNWDWRGTTLTEFNGLADGASELTNLNISGWNIAGIQYIRSYFLGNCGNYNDGMLKIDMSNWTAPDLISLGSAFYCYRPLRSINMSGWTELPSLTTTSNLFLSCDHLQRVDLSGFDTSHVTNMDSMFSSCTSLQNPDLTGLNTANVTTMSNMFGGCSALTKMDLSNWDVSKVTSTANMFGYCTNLQQVNMHGWNIASLEYLGSMFSGCTNLTDVNMSDWTVSNKKRDLNYMFNNCGKLKAVDFANWEGTVSSLSHTFYNCTSLTSLHLGALRGYSSNSYYDSAFSGCSNLEALDIHGHDMEAKNDSSMLRGLTKLNTFTRGYAKFSSSSGYDSISAPNGWTNGKQILDHNTLFTNAYSRWTYGGTWVKYTPDTPMEGDRITIDDRTQTKLELTVRLRGNESITFPNLPGGTAYNIYEETPEGWVLVKQSNASDVVPPNDTITARFENSYQPTSVAVQFHAVKYLDNQPAENGAFTFELVNGYTGKVIETVTNGPDGYVTFSPIVITYVRPYYYFIREVAGTNELIQYDTHAESVHVRVRRAENNTLTATVEYENGETGPVFKNTTVPGQLKLTKNVEGATLGALAAEPEFTYQVRLTNTFGEPVDPGKLTYAYTEAKAPSAVISADKQPQLVPRLPTSKLVLRMMEGSLLAQAAPRATTPSVKYPYKIYHVPADYDLEHSYAYAVVSTDKETMTFFRSYHDYRDVAVQYEDRGFGTAGHWVGMNNRTYDGYLLYGFEERSLATWQGVGKDLSYSLTTIKMDDPVKPQHNSMENWFANFKNLKSVKLDLMDTSNIENMGSLFYNSFWLNGRPTLDLSMWDTANVTNMAWMFGQDDELYGSSGDRLCRIDVSNFDTSKVTNMEYMFCGRDAIETLDVSNWNTANVTNMYGMFYFCEKLSTLRTDNWNVSKVTDFGFFAQYCKKLLNIYTSRWNPCSATSMGSMFEHCLSLSTVNVRNWDVSKVTNFTYMFNGDESLQTLDVSQWDVSNCEEAGDMFNGCIKLKKLDVSGWNPAKCYDFSGMFESCANLQELDVSKWTTLSARNYYNTFKGCSGLTKLNVSGFSTADGLQADGMCQDCTNLTYIDLSNFNISNEYDSVNIFENTSKLSRVTVNELTRIPRDYPICHEADDQYTGYWILEQGAFERRTSEELFAKEDATKAGTWIWETTERSHRFIMDPNGGSVDIDNVKVDYLKTGTLPIAVRPGYEFAGWNDKQDGTGKDYGTEYTNETGTPMPTPTKLYAKWVPVDGAASYIVEHYQQPVSLSETPADYYLANRDTIGSVTADSYVMPDYREYRGFYPITPKTSVQVKMNEHGAPLTRVAYYYNRKTYTISFDANGGEGSMSSMKVVTGITKKLLANTFTNGDYHFIGWNTEPDGSGITYVDGQFVNIFDVDTITLYAQWSHTGTVQSTDSVFTVKLKPGQTITFLDVPYGTQYEVVEVDIPEGWKLTEQQGETGSIGAGQVSTAEFTNTYTTSGKASPVVEKRMQAGVPEAGAYTFGLYLADDVVDGKIREGALPIDEAINEPLDERETIPDPNDHSAGPDVAMMPNPYLHRSMAYFHDLEYRSTPDGMITDGHTTSADGEFVYYIAELAGDDSNVLYDDTLRKVSVKVSDADGNGHLRTTVLYDGLSAGSFTNEYTTGSMQLSKTVKDATVVDAQKAFVFTVSFTDQQGGALTGTYPCAITTAEGTKQSVLMLENGQATLELKDGESVLISELPEGTGYTVTEQPEDGFTAHSEHSAGTIVNGEVAKVTYENAYHASGSVQLQARKRLTPGMTLKADEFSFELRDAKGDLLETVTNDEDGNVIFTPLHYTVYDVGEHVYYLTEHDSAYSDEPLYAYSFDNTQWKVTVTVKDNGDGTLQVTPVYEAEGNKQTEAATFLNSTQTMVRVRKVWNDADRQEKRPTMITVRVYGDGKEVAHRVLSQVVNSEDANTWEASFTGLPKYNAEGKEIQYTATEDGIKDYSMAVDETQTDQENNVSIVTITNTYQEVRVLLGGHKIVEHWSLEAGEYTFELSTDMEGIPMPEKYVAANEADGSFTFGEVAYHLSDLDTDELGNYIPTIFEYMIVEQLPAEPKEAMTYDLTPQIVQITLRWDEATQTLQATANQTAEETEFVNRYASVGQVVLVAKKVLEGHALTEGQFSFELLDEEGHVLQTQRNAADGTVTFAPLHFTEADVDANSHTGRKTYVIQEAVPEEAAPGYTYDTHAELVTVALTDQGDGTITAVASRNAATPAKFTNEYHAKGSVVLKAEKLLDDKEPGSAQFRFTLTMPDGTEQTVENNGSSISFPEIQYTERDVGKTYTYTVREVKELSGDYVCDATVYTVEVAVSDNGDGTLKTETAIMVDGEAQEHIIFRNRSIEKASLRIEKKVVSSQPVTRSFLFTVKLMDENGQLLTGSYAYEGAVKGVLEHGTGKISLCDGEAVEIRGLPVGTRFTVEEAEDPAFTVNKTVIAGSEGNDVTPNGATVTFENVATTTQLSITKRWVGDEGGAITLTLGTIIDDTFVPYEQAPEAEQVGDSYIFRNLPKYDAEGQLITWAVQEKTYPGYGLKRYVNRGENKDETRWALDGATIVNTQTVDVRVQKVWKNVNGEKPEITLTLYKDGEPTSKRPTKLENGWYVFYNLEVNHTYYVVEEPLPGYTVTYVNGDGYAEETTRAYPGGKIVNTKTEIEIPPTGDNAPLAAWIVGVAVGLLGILLVQISCRKKRED